MGRGVGHVFLWVTRPTPPRLISRSCGLPRTHSAATSARSRPGINGETSGEAHRRGICTAPCACLARFAAREPHGPPFARRRGSRSARLISSRAATATRFSPPTERPGEDVQPAVSRSHGAHACLRRRRSKRFRPNRTCRDRFGRRVRRAAPPSIPPRQSLPPLSGRLRAEPSSVAGVQRGVKRSFDPTTDGVLPASATDAEDDHTALREGAATATAGPSTATEQPCVTSLTAFVCFVCVAVF